MNKAYLLPLASYLLLFGCQSSVSEDSAIAVDQELPEYLLNRVTPVDDREYLEIQVDDQKLKVEKADTPQKIETGLSYRSVIGADGMLFYMPQRGVPTFWMKGMLMDLDMVWIDCQNQNSEFGTSNIDDAFDELVGKTVKIMEAECLVVDVSRNVPKAEDPTASQNNTIRSPKAPVTHVLETKVGDLK